MRELHLQPMYAAQRCFKSGLLLVGRSHSISHISQVGFWPDEAIEWYLTRRRRKVRDKRTGVFYQWPPQEVVAQARQIGFNVIPMGFLEPKKQA